MRNHERNHSDQSPHQVEIDLYGEDDTTRALPQNEDRKQPAPARETTRYSRSELFALWHDFRWQKNELEMMMDFSLLSQKRAKNLINEFRSITGLPPIDEDPRNQTGKQIPAVKGRPGRPRKTPF